MRKLAIIAGLLVVVTSAGCQTDNRLPEEKRVDALAQQLDDQFKLEARRAHARMTEKLLRARHAKRIAELHTAEGS